MRNKVSISIVMMLLMATSSINHAGDLLKQGPKATCSLPEGGPQVGDWASATGEWFARIYMVPDSGYRCHIVKDLQSLEQPLARLTGEERDGKLTFSGEGWEGVVLEQEFKLEKGSEMMVMRPFLRESPTLNDPPSPGAIVLFDGSSMDAFGKLAPKQWLVSSGPSDSWKIVSGEAMEVVPGSGSIVSNRQFGDFFLHAEFRLLGKPTNGGIYLQSRYEVNIKDSYGQIGGTPCGALGNILEPEIPGPAVNPAAPPMQWQTLDIDFRAPRFDQDGEVKTENARISLVYNGVPVYDNVEIKRVKGAAGRLGEAAEGPIYLQEHGTAYQFRNIWIIDKTNK